MGPLDVDFDAWTLPTLPSATGEEFVDYRSFSYNRAATFPGCATYLHVPTLTWHVAPIRNVVPFGALPPVTDGAGTVHNVAGFAQLVDDVRAVVNYIHENDVMIGFFIDPVGQNTCGSQTPPDVLHPEPLPDPGIGYWMATEDGEVYEFGGSLDLGDANLDRVVDIESVNSGQGYWVTNSSGTVAAHGGARWYGNLRASQLRTGERVTSIAGTPTARGYRLFTTMGRVFAYGDASHLGDMGAVTLKGPVLDSVSTPSGRGYYMVASDGGVFTFGATFSGSMGGIPLNRPVVGMAADPDGRGYWLVASDGGVFTFSARFVGSLGDRPPTHPVVAIAPLHWPDS